MMRIEPYLNYLRSIYPHRITSQETRFLINGEPTGMIVVEFHIDLLLQIRMGTYERNVMGFNSDRISHYFNVKVERYNFYLCDSGKIFDSIKCNSRSVVKRHSKNGSLIEDIHV